MTISWDSALVDELVGRRVIVFLGAGATMSCARSGPGGVVDSTPSWPGLLALLLAASSCGDDDRDAVEKLCEKDRYLDAAQIIRSRLTPQEYSRILTQEFKNLETGTLHDAILRLDQRIVMTTNYDTAYEDLCRRGDGRDGYSVFNYYDSNIMNRLRSPTRLILKLHGSVKTPEQTVLTRSEFFKAKTKYPRFFNLMQSLFSTNTLLFVGYSLSDPDIQLLLENSAEAGEDVFGHYAVVPNGDHPEVDRATAEAYGINLIKYDSSKGHEDVAQSLAELADAVEGERSLT